MNIFDEDNHISIEAMQKLKEGKLCGEELMAALDHITECSECAGIFADSYDEKELVEVPEGFEESIELNMSIKKKKKFNFQFYCMKVIAAAAIAIIMVFSNQLSFMSSLNSTKIKAPDYNKVNNVCSTLNSISEKIINLEVHK